MSEVQSWIFTICAGALICGIVAALTPSKAYEKAIQLLLGLFMLFCFLMPITANWEVPTVDVAKAERQREEAFRDTQSLAESTVQEGIIPKFTETAGTLLADYGIGDGEVTIAMEEEKAGNPLAVVTLPGRLREHGGEITQRLTAGFGMPVSLVFTAESLGRETQWGRDLPVLQKP